MAEKTFEQSMKELEEIVESLQSGESDLDKAYTLFEKGVALVKECENKLKEVRSKVVTMVDNGQERDYNEEND